MNNEKELSSEDSDSESKVDSKEMQKID